MKTGISCSNLMAATALDLPLALGPMRELKSPNSSEADLYERKLVRSGLMKLGLSEPGKSGSSTMTVSSGSSGANRTCHEAIAKAERHCLEARGSQRT